MKKRIISLDITSIPYSEFIDKICYLATEKISSYICVANVHMCIEAYDDAEFQNIVNNADLVTPDGMPLAKGIQWLYGTEQERGDDGFCYVEDDVWIGHGVIIVGGIKIGKGSIIAAGSVVTKDIPSCEIWGGVPAIKLKNRFNSEADKQNHLDYLKLKKNENSN